MTRRAAAAGLLLAGLLAPLALGGPATAGSGVGCTGSTCSVLLSNVIALKGDFGATGTTQVPLAVPPPPCLWQSIGDTATGSRYIIQNFGFAAPSTPFGVVKSVQQARGFLKDHPVPGRLLVAAAGQPGRVRRGAAGVQDVPAVRLGRTWHNAR